MVVALAFIFLETQLQNDLVWELTDMFNNLMVIPNVIGLAALAGAVAISCREAAGLKDDKIKKG